MTFEIFYQSSCAIFNLALRKSLLTNDNEVGKQKIKNKVKMLYNIFMKYVKKYYYQCASWNRMINVSKKVCE